MKSLCSIWFLYCVNSSIFCFYKSLHLFLLLHHHWRSLVSARSGGRMVDILNCPIWKIWSSTKSCHKCDVLCLSLRRKIHFDSMPCLLFQLIFRFFRVVESASELMGCSLWHEVYKQNTAPAPKHSFHNFSLWQCLFGSDLDGSGCFSPFY